MDSPPKPYFGPHNSHGSNEIEEKRKKEKWLNAPTSESSGKGLKEPKRATLEEIEEKDYNPKYPSK